MLDVITENIDVWMSAKKSKTSVGRGRSKNNKQSEYGIMKLRQLILELAVMGKLVPQDPNDEPASKLLEKVLEENKKIVKEKNIRKPRKVPSISKNEVNIKLPTSWEYVRNGNLFSLRKGKKPKNISNNEIGLPYLDIEALDRNNILRFTNDESCPQSTVEDILVVCDGSRSGLVLDGKDGVVGSTLAVIDIPKIIQPYIKLMFMEAFQKLNSSMKGAAIPHLDTKNLIQEIVGLPPLNEQHRIIAKVDELMVFCDQLEQQQTDSDTAHRVLVETLLGTLTESADNKELQENWLRIANHFDTLFATEYSIDQLKETILQLAIMGKLVPQDPNDEPASELLKKIANEKARLIKEGKIRKQERLSDISDEEKLYKLPRTWKVSRVGDIFTLKSGNSFKKESELEIGDYIYVKVADMNLSGNENDITTSSRFMNPSEKELNALIPAGSIIFPKRGGAIATNKKRLVKQKIFVDLNIMSITPYKGIDLGYAYLWLSGIDLALLNSGTSVPQINNKDIVPLIFPVPPLTEQHRIVTKVDELMTLCDTLKAKINDAQTTKIQLADTIVEIY